MKIVGYGICGPGEASRYMRETMEEFKRLCDEVVILLNGSEEETAAEKALAWEYGFRTARDTREWGKLQWKIKQDFLEGVVGLVAKPGDIVIALDMDERFDKHLTRDWLLSMEFDAVHTYVVDLWNDEQHYKPESCFWKVQIFRWNGDVAFKPKPLHCGLVPLWAASMNRYAPFLQIHKGLMDPESRKRKIARYEKYDPLQQYLGKQYYWMLRSDTAVPFDEEQLHATIEAEVASYKQKKPRNPITSMAKKGRFAYVQNAGGHTVDVPEKHLARTLKQPGMRFIGWADEAQKEMESLFEDEEITDGVRGDGPAGATPEPTYSGTGMRPMAEEKAEFDALNARDEAQISGVDLGAPEGDKTVVEPAPEPKATPAKKSSAKKPAAKKK